MQEFPQTSAGTASARSQVYGLLASIFRGEPDVNFVRDLKAPRFAGALSSLDVDLGEDFRQSDDEELCENLAVEYTRLFMGPGSHISPHESVFVDVDGDTDLDIVAGLFFPTPLPQNRLFLNDGSGVFTDATVTSLPLWVIPTRALEAGDVDVRTHVLGQHAAERVLERHDLHAAGRRVDHLPPAALGLVAIEHLEELALLHGAGSSS